MEVQDLLPLQGYKMKSITILTLLLLVIFSVFSCSNESSEIDIYLQTYFKDRSGLDLSDPTHFNYLRNKHFSSTFFYPGSDQAKKYFVTSGFTIDKIERKIGQIDFTNSDTEKKSNYFLINLTFKNVIQVSSEGSFLKKIDSLKGIITLVEENGKLRINTDTRIENVITFR